LFLAVHGGHVDVVTELIARYSDPVLAHREGRPPIEASFLDSYLLRP
jgi:hypothetical protein